MSIGEPLDGFNKPDLWLYYAKIINDELNTIYKSENDTFSYKSTIHSLDDGSKIFLDPLYNFRTWSHFSAHKYITATPYYVEDNNYNEENEKEDNDYKYIILRAVKRYIHPGGIFNHIYDTEMLREDSIKIYTYGKDKAEQNIKRNIDMNDVLVDDKYLLLCKEVTLSFESVYITSSIVDDTYTEEDARKYDENESERARQRFYNSSDSDDDYNRGYIPSDSSNLDKGWIFTIVLEIVDESLLRPPTNYKELGGKEYEKSKTRFVRNQ